ncbi:MAG: aminotransferase class I/II-fold pyridoxal phosphate-dependent enzyme [Myxococcales bacterium]|nr:aminotransferase class I/II-fold pyridoxal phosphate-dependent enzyme [Myxococcales bacterium]
MAHKLSTRSQRVTPFIAMDIMQDAARREAAGQSILHLEVGQPSCSLPSELLTGAADRLQRSSQGYTVALGLDELRAAIAEDYRKRYGVTVDPRRVAVTTGSSGAFLLSFTAAFDAGDRVAMAVPGYPAYKNILESLGIEVVEVRVGAETHFQPTPETLERCGKLDGLIVASPTNPSGSMLSPKALRELCEYCDGRGVRLISDEIYHGLTYSERASTAAAFTQTAYVINSFSKYRAMTGWRIGWMIVPEEHVRVVECLAQNLFICPPTLSQWIAVESFSHDAAFDEVVEGYKHNRDVLLNTLGEVDGLEFAPADGAFYLYANVKHFCEDSTLLCAEMIEEIGVATTPGWDFDPSGGGEWIRLSYAGSAEVIAEAAKRIAAWLPARSR